MAADHHPRYVVQEICWQSVREYPSERFSGANTYAMNKARADALCARLNAEHDAWLACA